MKKIILICFGIVSLQAFAQVEIRLPDDVTSVSGQTITVDFNLNDVDPNDQWAYWAGTKFHVYNGTGTDEQLRLKRVRVSVPSDWDDQLCWPPTCYPTSGDNFLTPSTGTNPAPTVLAGTSTTNLNNAVAEIKPQIYPGAPGSSATYKYYVTDNSGSTNIDSVTIVFNYTNNLSIASAQAQKTTELTLVPNPASENVTFQAEGIDGKIKIVDVLGNVVYNESFNTIKKLNVSDFRNGVYFVTIQSSGMKDVTKKLIVRH